MLAAAAVSSARSGMVEQGADGEGLVVGASAQRWSRRDA
jgi:hypothetical protein